MATSTIKLIIEMENLAKQQLQLMQEQLEQIQAVAKQLDTVLDTIDAAGINRVNSEVSNLSNQFNHTSESSAVLNNSLKAINSSGIRQVSASAAQANTTFIQTMGNVRLLNTSIRSINGSSLNTTNISAKLLDTTLVATKGSANQLDNALDSVNGSGMNNSVSVAEMLRAIIAVLIGIGQELKMILDSLANTGLDDAARDADLLREKLIGAGNAGNGLKGLGNNARSAGAGLGFLRSAASMTVGMIGFDLVNGFMEAGRASINATSNLEYFGERLGMSSSEFSQFNSKLDEMQKQFRKVNMKAVGAAAEEMAVKLNIPKESMEELTKTTAVMSSAFVKEGRTETDAILAVSDALDGQFRRLQELGITQDMLKNNGWNGDLKDKTSLLQAMNATLDDMGFTQTAQDIVTLDDAYQALTVSGGQLLEKILVPITPLLIAMADAAMNAFDTIGDFISSITAVFVPNADTISDTTEELSENMADAQEVIDGVKDAAAPAAEAVGELSDAAGGLSEIWSNMPQWQKDIVYIGGLSLAFLGLSIVIIQSVIPAISSAILSFLGYVGGAFGVEMANLGLASSFWAVTSAMLASPLTWVVVALVAIAVAVYEVGKQLGWWHDIPSMLASVTDGLRRLWDAFINNPHVQEFLKEMKSLWDAICNALKPLIDYAKQVWEELFPKDSNPDIVRGIIDAFGTLGDILATIVGAAKAAMSGFGSFINYLATVGGPIGFVRDILKTVVCILLGCSPGIVPALRKTQEVFSIVWNAIVGFLSGIISTVVSAMQPVIDILTQIVDYLITAFSPAWDLVVQIFNIIIGAVMQIVQAFSDFMNGQISLPELLMTIWTTIQSTFVQILLTILSSVWSWVDQLTGGALTAGANFVNGIITWISQLPARVWAWLTQTAQNILSAGSQWVNNAKTKASEMVNGAVNNVQQLPGKIYTEFSKIPGKIRDAAINAVKAASEFGQKVLDAVLNVLGIHSPGFAQKKIDKEFKDTVQRIFDNVDSAKTAGKSFGQGIMDGFESSDINDGLNVDLNPNVSGEATGSVSISQESDGSDDTGGSYYSLLDDVIFATDSIDMNNESIGESFNFLTESIGNDTALIQSNVAGIVSSFNTTQLGVNTSLSSMTSSNNAAWSNIKSSTQSNLSAIQSSTANVTGKMVDAWGKMKNNIVTSANDIRTQSYNKFSSLHRSISSFYNQLANARFSSGLPAGPGGNNRVSIGRSTPIGGRISTSKGPLKGMFAGGLGKGRGRIIDSNSKVRRKQSRESSIYSNLLDYNLPVDIMNDITRLNGYNPKTAFAGTADTNVNKIMNTAYPWKIGDPWFLGIRIPSDFHVRDFKDGKQPTIDNSNFEDLLRKILTARGFRNPATYDFYYNSQKSNQQVWDQVRCNCMDGAEMILEIAQMLGLSGGLIHGSWNGIGHMAASIGGKIYDMTQFQKRGVFRGSSGVSFGSSSSGSSNDIFNRLFERVDDIAGFFKNGITNFAFTNNAGNSDNIVSYSNDKIELTVDMNHNINITGDTENIDTESIIDAIKEFLDDKNIIDKIAEALLKRERKLKRMGGI